MNATTLMYLAYLGLSLAVVAWVGRTLFTHGRILLVEAMRGNEPLADSVNHLTVVGFYLVNAGLVSLFLRSGDEAMNLEGALLILSWKVGVVLLVLGLIHLLCVCDLIRMRKRTLVRRTET